MEDSMTVPQKIKIELPNDLSVLLLSIYPNKTIIQKVTCSPIFIAALFSRTKTWKQVKCPSADEWIKKKWYTYKMEYYSTIKKKERMPFAALWMELQIIILSEVSQKDKCHTILPICGI